MVYRYCIEQEPPNEDEDEDERFLIKVINAIKKYSMVAGADASVKWSYIGGY